MREHYNVMKARITERVICTVRAPFLFPARLSHDSNIWSTNFPDGAGRQDYLLTQRAEPVLFSTRCFLRTEGQPILMEVTQDEPALVDYLNPACSGRFAQLWVSLVWLCALRPLWRAGAHPPPYVPH